MLHARYVFTVCRILRVKNTNENLLKFDGWCEVKTCIFLLKISKILRDLLFHGYVSMLETLIFIGIFLSGFFYKVFFYFQKCIVLIYWVFNFFLSGYDIKVLQWDVIKYRVKKYRGLVTEAKFQLFGNDMKFHWNFGSRVSQSFTKFQKISQSSTKPYFRPYGS